MAEQTGKYGRIIAKTTLADDIPIVVSVSESPFGEHYLIVSAFDDVIVSGLAVEKKRTGSIEFRQRINSVVHINQTEQPEPKKDRSL
jgi:hypothetical protein